jgi:hypothetical protein
LTTETRTTIEFTFRPPADSEGCAGDPSLTPDAEESHAIGSDRVVSVSVFPVPA